ncbi:hypothetical protein RZS08_63980 [Arthrospira platensis SPKY1]|nr:hypothetical protein [Arthrospira platensis SPKY1]
MNTTDIGVFIPTAIPFWSVQVATCPETELSPPLNVIVFIPL